MPIHAGYSELINAYQQHKQTAGNNITSSHKLLYFYAVECGLKHAYLRRNNLKRTEQLPSYLLSHDLGNLAKELRIPANAVGTVPQFKLYRDGSNHKITSAHEAWRYGIRIQPTDEETLVKWLQGIVEWLQRSVLI